LTQRQPAGARASRCLAKTRTCVWGVISQVCQFQYSITYAVSPTNSSPSESSTGIGDDPSLESASSWSSARVESMAHPYLWNQWWARSRATLGSAQAPCGVLPTRTSKRDRLGYSGSSLGSAATRAALAESSAINLSA